MNTDKMFKILGLRAESHDDCQFQEKADMEIAEIRLHCIQHQDIRPAPLIQALL